jgi:hypothetical protein
VIWGICGKSSWRSVISLNAKWTKADDRYPMKRD